MKNFIPLLFLIAPLFALVFLLKCVDMHTYKENSGAKRTVGCVIISLLIILLSHLAAAVIGSRITMGGKLFEPLPGLLLILLLPLTALLLSVLALLFIYPIGQKTSDGTGHSKKALGFNLAVTGSFSILYFLLTVWNMVFIGKPEFNIMDEAKQEVFSKGNCVQLLIAVLLLLAALWFKISRTKSAKKTAEEQPDTQKN